MFDKITYISNDGCDIKLFENAEVTTNLMNLHLVFEDENKKVLGEVDDLKGDIVKARKSFVGYEDVQIIHFMEIENEEN